MSVKLDEIEKHAEAIAGRENCVFYDLELSGAGKNQILRIFIDKDGAEGVSITDCSNVSRALDLILDVEDLMGGGAFHLEVSSPGLERRLRREWHFAKVIGKKVRIQMDGGVGLEMAPEDGNRPKTPRKKVVGVVQSARDGEVEVRIEGGETSAPDDGMLKIPIKNIKKAQVVFDFNQGYHPKQ